MPQSSEGSSTPRRRRDGPVLARTFERLRWAPRASLALVALTSAACSDVTGVEEVRSEMLPPTSYRVLWDRVEECSGRSGDFDGLTWFWVRSFPDDTDALGQWNGRHEITLALAAVGNRGVVAHELLHELLEGDPSHLDPAWDACGIPRGGS